MSWKDRINRRTENETGVNSLGLEAHDWDSYSDEVLEALADADSKLKEGTKVAKAEGYSPYPNSLAYDGAQEAWSLRQEKQRIQQAISRDLQLHGNAAELPRFDPVEWQDYLAYLNKPGKEFPISRQSLLELSIVSTYVLREGMRKGVRYWRYGREQVSTPQLPEEVVDAIQVQFRLAGDGTGFKPDIGNGQKYERDVDLAISINRPKLYKALLNMPVSEADNCLKRIEVVLKEGLTAGYFHHKVVGSRSGYNSWDKFRWDHLGEELEKEPRKKYLHIYICPTNDRGSSSGMLHLIARYAEKIIDSDKVNTLNLARYKAQFQEGIDNARREKMHQLARIEPDTFETSLRLERLAAMAQLPSPTARRG